MSMYFLFLDDKSLEEKLPSLMYTKGKISNVRLVDNELYQLINFLTCFPSRILKDVIISVGNEKYLVCISNAEYLPNFLGVFVSLFDKIDMPLDLELELADNVFSVVNEGYIKNSVDFNDLRFLFEDYKKKLSANLFNKIRMHREGHYLEKVIDPVPREDYIVKWDFFMLNIAGQPITNIFRYQSNKGFYILDMSSKVILPNFNGTLGEFHSLNCAGLSSFYNFVLNLKKIFNKETKLIKTTSYLHNAKGYGFTFFDYVENVGMLVLDVKNKFVKNDKYVHALFGNEEKTLKAIKNEIIMSEYILKEFIRNYNKKGSTADLPSVNSKIYEIFKQQTKKYTLWK